MKWLVVAVIVAGCSRSESAQPPEERPAISETELARGRDACQAYIAKVCACTVPAAKEACSLAKMLPDAIRVQLEVARSPDSSVRDTALALDGVRKTAKECIEQIAKLPAMGCN
jgi:hypothetical protein